MENAVIVRLRHFFYWGLQLMDIFLMFMFVHDYDFSFFS